MMEADGVIPLAVRHDAAAFQQLLEGCRPRLKRCVSLRMDPRLSARFDASDVVQDALTHALQHRDDFAGDDSRPFYSWLREIACNRLLDLHRRHVGAQRRSVTREEPIPWSMCEYHDELATALVDSASGPNRRLEREETLKQVRVALGQLRPVDREILVMRHLEQLSVDEIADALQISHTNVSTRHLRALQKLQHILADKPSG